MKALRDIIARHKAVSVRRHLLGLLGASARHRSGAAPCEEQGTVALIEATSNQVNQDSGYTGVRPADFRRFVLQIAARCEFPLDHLLHRRRSSGAARLAGIFLLPRRWKRPKRSSRTTSPPGFPQDSSGLLDGMRRPIRAAHGCRHRRSSRSALRNLRTHVAAGGWRSAASTSSVPKCRCPMAHTKRSRDFSPPGPPPCAKPSKRIEQHSNRPDCRMYGHECIEQVVQPGVEFDHLPRDRLRAGASQRTRVAHRVRAPHGFTRRTPLTIRPRKTCVHWCNGTSHSQSRPRADLRAARSAMGARPDRARVARRRPGFAAARDACVPRCLPTRRSGPGTTPRAAGNSSSIGSTA